VTPPPPPAPSRQPIARYSPTLLEALLACPLKAAFSHDPAFRRLRRPTPASLLGQAAHRLTEAASKGRFEGLSGQALRQALEQAWSAEVAAAAATLGQAWTVAPPPPPRDWPGYELTRVRLLRRLTRLVDRRRDQAAAPAGRGPTVMVEQALQDSTTGLHGRPDRVETSGAGTRVVDLKTGWTQQPEIRDGQRRQLLLYAYLVFRASGTWPAEIAIEDASGRRATEPVHPEQATAAVDQAVQAIERYNAAIRTGRAPLSLATPSPDACRYCPFRAVCEPYWKTATADWPMLPSVLGAVTATSPAVGRVQLAAAQPIQLTGSTITVLGIGPAALPGTGEHVGIVDAYPTGQDGEFQARWITQVERWTDS
jgi:hypothetical protein